MVPSLLADVRTTSAAAEADVVAEAAAAVEGASAAVTGEANELERAQP